MSGKRGQPGRLRRMTVKERAKKLARDVRRDREAKLRKKFMIPAGEPLNRVLREQRR